MDFVIGKVSTSGIKHVKSVIMANKSVVSRASHSSDTDDDFQMVINLLARERQNVEKLWTRLNGVICAFNACDDRIVAFYLAQREMKQDVKTAINDNSLAHLRAAARAAQANGA